jgi:tripartite-type tricarboxylate transporter receptor subunit TctC
MRRLINVLWISAILFGLVTFSHAASDYPNRPITIINPMAAGGTLDLQARAFGTIAEKILGKPFAVVNKTGASGLIGWQAGAQAFPDGYTLAVSSVGLTTIVEWELANGRKPPVTRHDFIPICAFTMTPTLIIVPSDSPWKTVADLINDAKTKPGFYAFSHGGLYGMSHLPAEIFAKATGLKFRQVPFSGGNPAVSAVVGKHVDFATQYPPVTLPLIRANKLRALAVQSNKRLSYMPNVPTLNESGIDAEFYGWVGLLAPKNTPPQIVEKLKDVAEKVAKDKVFIDTIEKPGDEVIFMNSAEMTKYWDEESEKIGKICTELVKEAQKK